MSPRLLIYITPVAIQRRGRCSDINLLFRYTEIQSRKPAAYNITRRAYFHSGVYKYTRIFRRSKLSSSREVISKYIYLAVKPLSEK
jgi:hypothetical protein